MTSLPYKVLTRGGHISNNCVQALDLVRWLQDMYRKSSKKT